VSGDQLIVLGLLVLAFGIGWVTRGEGRRRRRRGDAGGRSRPALLALVEEAGDALDRAIVACTAARAMAGTDAESRAVALDVLAAATGELGAISERLGGELGAEHPLAEELHHGATAVGFVEAWLAEGAGAEGAPAQGAEAARGLERAARDALTRYRRLAEAVASFPSAD
jgi:hypothetical protein